jgi:hypothetical protein
MDNGVHIGKVLANQRSQALDRIDPGWQRGGFPHIRTHERLPPAVVHAI